MKKICIFIMSILCIMSSIRIYTFGRGGNWGMEEYTPSTEEKIKELRQQLANETNDERKKALLRQIANITTDSDI